MKIIYIHGFNSDGNGDTARKLKQHYKDDIICPSYDYINADKGYQQLNNLISSHLKDDNLILVGTSLGGFFANYFSEKYDLKCILVNPSLDPSVSLNKFIGITKNFSTGKEIPFTENDVEKYKKYKTTESPNIYKTIFLGAKDNVIDYKTTAEHFKNRNVIIDQDEEHRIGDINKLIKLIDEMKNTFVIHQMDDIKKNNINEHFINASINDKSIKEKYVDEVWDILTRSYNKIGGLKGSGFESKEDMINKIPFWKMSRRNGKIIAVRLYKDKLGRKAVAMGSDGTSEGLKDLKSITKEELVLNRAYSEISGPALAILVRNNPDIEKYCIPYYEVEKMVFEEIRRPQASDPEMIKYPELRKFFYQRFIGDGFHTKICIGKIGNEIY